MTRERRRAQERCTPDAAGKIRHVELDYFSHHSRQIEGLFRQPRSDCGKTHQDCDGKFYTVYVEFEFTRRDKLEFRRHTVVFLCLLRKTEDGVLYLLTFYEFILFI